jgi:hypothetical protein
MHGMVDPSMPTVMVPVVAVDKVEVTLDPVDMDPVEARVLDPVMGLTIKSVPRVQMLRVMVVVKAMARTVEAAAVEVEDLGTVTHTVNHVYSTEAKWTPGIYEVSL